MLEQRKQTRIVKLEALRQAMRDGLKSGLGEMLDMEAIKTEAREETSEFLSKKAAQSTGAGLSVFLDRVEDSKPDAGDELMEDHTVRP